MLQGRLAIGIFAFVLVAAAVWADSARAQTRAASRVIAEIRVEGAQRIEPETVRSYMTVRVGDVVDAAALDKSLKGLFATSLFADVTIRREGSVIIVRVVENPIINRLAFEGNNRISDEILNDEVQLRPRIVFTRSKVQADVQRILDLYRRSGRFAALVEPKVIQLEQNRVDLVFEIKEGKLTEIRTINFIGNRKFSDSSLRGAIQTKESAWYRFFGGSDTYDPDRLTFDRELLRRHYLKNGYADFRVVSVVAELAPDKEGFFITFTVEEGTRYRFGKIDVSTALRNLDAEELHEHVTVEQGDWYDADAVEDTVSNLSDAAGSFGYAFVDVRPKVKRERDKRLINITFDIREGPRVFVERINISGNVRTADRVIRREIALVEGDAFNTEKLRRTRRRIRNLGYFEKVEIKNTPGSAPDKTVVDVAVQEQSTGEISFGAGFSSTAGVLGDISIRERNLVGEGQDLRLSLQVGQLQQQIDLSFTEPYMFDRNVSGGIDAFRTARDLQRESSFDRESIGVALRTGYRITDPLRQRWRYTIRQDDITDVASDASLSIKEQEGRTVTSSISHTLIYDKRDNRFLPTEGYVVDFTNEFAGLGGNVNFLKNQLSGTVYYPLTEEFIASIRLGGGYIFGIDDTIRVIDRFFLGSNTFRGFDRAGVGPRDPDTGDALGGNWFWRGTLEVGFPLGLPSEFGVRGRVFSDVGSVGGVDSSLPEVNDTGSPRLSVGAGLGWNTPLGPISIDYGKALLKEDFDQTQTIRFSFGTRF